MNIKYIFNPEEVTLIIKDYDDLKNKIRAPHREGERSTSFLSARKSPRQIYRILTNLHYNQLQQLLADLNLCIKSGWDQPKLLKTRYEPEFDSAVSELAVAIYFIKSGFKVSGFDDAKEQVPVPDILISNNEFQCECEVYSPRDWDGLEYYKEDLRLSLKNLDIPWDFHFTIRMDIINPFNPDGSLNNFNPWQFSDHYSSPTNRDTIIGPFINEIEINLLQPQNSNLTTKLIDKPRNIITKVLITDLEKSTDSAPSRFGVILGPTLTGYAPEGMFENLVKHRINKKVQRRQTGHSPGEYFEALFIDVSNLAYVGEFYHEFYRKEFSKSINRHLDLTSSGIDLIIFFLPNQSEDRTLEILYVLKHPKLSDDIVKAILR